MGVTYPLATAGSLPKDAVIYTKASIFKVNPGGATTSLDGNVTLRVDAHEGCTTNTSKTTLCSSGQAGPDKIGFTVLSTKDSSLYYSNNWVFDSLRLAWATVPQSMTQWSAVSIN